MTTQTKYELLENLRQESTFKILFVGDYGVGKTSIIRSYVDGRFLSNYKVTVGVDFVLKSIVWKNDEKLNLQFWDVAGNERSYKFLTSAYYRYASAAIIVVDSIVPNYVASIEQWATGLRHNLDLSIPIVLLVNKCDLQVSRIDREVLNQVCKKHNLIGWFQVSAKTRENIEEAINCILSEMITSKSRKKLLKVEQTDAMCKNMAIFTQIDSYTVTSSEAAIEQSHKENTIVKLNSPKMSVTKPKNDTSRCC